MKNSIINIGLISTLLIGQLALAQDEFAPSVESNRIETIVITAKPEVANFEIYSLKITGNAINSSMELMLNDPSLAITKNEASLVNASENTFRSI